MRILLDENCDRLLVRALRDAGHSVEHVADLGPGISDDMVLELASNRDCVLVSQDLDFGLLLSTELLPPAIVLLRTHPLSVRRRAEIVATFFATLGDDYRGKLFVIEPGMVRERLYAEPGITE